MKKCEEMDKEKKEEKNHINIKKLEKAQSISQSEKEEIIKNKNKDTVNEIICIFNNQEDEIKLLHDYNLDFNWPHNKYKKDYLDGKKI